MIQHSIPFHKIARTNHRKDFEFVAVLLPLELVCCENAVKTFCTNIQFKDFHSIKSCV